MRCSCGSTTGPTCSSAAPSRPSAQRLIRLLTAAVADAARPLGSLAILDDSRARHDPRGLQRHRRRRCAAATLPSLFAAQAARTPDAVAVVFEDRSAELRGARRPRQPRWRITCARSASGPDVLVGLCVERSVELVVGLLGGAQGRRRLCAAGSGSSAAPDCRHDRGRRAWRGADAEQAGARALPAAGERAARS